MQNNKDRRLLAQALFSPPMDDAAVDMPPLPLQPMPQQLPPNAIAQLNPAQNFYRQGIISLENHDYPGAAQNFQKTLEIDPSHAGAKVSLDHVTQVLGQNTRLGRITSGPYRGFR